MLRPKALCNYLDEKIKSNLKVLPSLLTQGFS